MALRGKKPIESTRLRALVSAKAGVGKSVAMTQMPRPYLIDCESGLEHYGPAIEKAGGVVFNTTNLDEVIDEVKSLIAEDHNYVTLVIDPLTTLWEQAVNDAVDIVGDGFGKHTAHAGRKMNRLVQLLTTLDMNVFMTAHSKDNWKDGENIGETFDGWKKSDYIADVHFHLYKLQTGERIAEVKKTRLTAFPDMERFEWSYDAIAEKYGKDKLERKADRVELASAEQVVQFTGLLTKLSDDEKKRLKIDKAIHGFDDFGDMPAAKITAGIALLTKHLTSEAA